MSTPIDETVVWALARQIAKAGDLRMASSRMDNWIEGASIASAVLGMVKLFQ